MVTAIADLFPAFNRTGAAYFPAYQVAPQGASLLHVQFVNPLGPHAVAKDHPLSQFELVIYRHGSFAAEWPIRVDVPTALKGFRHALGLSQVKFAAALGQNRLNIERWESGKARPFRGHILALLSLLRPLASEAVSAGQLLNLAAAEACPKLTRPAAAYSGRQIADLLADKHYDHSDLAPALLSALVDSEVLVPMDTSTREIDGSYIPAVGVRTIDRPAEPWEAELSALARRLEPNDRKLWLSLGERLSRSRPVQADLHRPRG